MFKKIQDSHAYHYSGLLAKSLFMKKLFQKLDQLHGALKKSKILVQTVHPAPEKE